MENITENLTYIITDPIGFTPISLRPISSYFNIPHGLMGYAIFLVASLAFFLMSYLWIRSMLLSSFVSFMPIFIGMTLGVIPIWIGVLFSIMSFYVIFNTIMGVPENIEVATEPNVGSQWDEYGLRIKNAYTAKFGGENNGFNEEVDNRIAIMNHNGRGFTRTIAYDWLKRMARFTEAK